MATPRGFRDVLPEEALWREGIAQAVGACFAEAGYLPVETPVLEARDLLMASDAAEEGTFRLFDGDGRCLMLRPDVTLPVARMVATRLPPRGEPLRLRYSAPVFRESDPLRGEARQFTQLGVELIDHEGGAADAEVLLLMMRALEAAGVGDCVVSVGSVRPLDALLSVSGMDDGWCRQVRVLFHRCDLVGLDELLAGEGAPSPEVARALWELPRVRGGREAVERARSLLAPCGCASGCLDELDALLAAADGAGVAGRVAVDFSVMGAFGYYTGMVFEANAAGMGERLGQGGRYDRVLGRFGAPRPAAGFALSLDALQAAAQRRGDLAGRPLRVAVSKGSLFPGAVELLARAGLDTAGLADAGRQLVVHAGDVDYIIVRPTDAPSFVAFGGADCGICGRDSLVEAGLEVLELVGLRYGDCRMVVAEPSGARDRIERDYQRLGRIRVASKYPHIARSYFERIGIEADVLKFHGNIELAPLVGMADRIVDITATGTTLRENDLVVVDEVMQCSARFFANPSAARSDARVFDLARRLERAVRRGADAAVPM